MAQSKSEQNFSNHVRFDPAFHFFLAPVALITLVGVIVRAVRYPTPWTLWSFVIALAGVVALLVIRTYALKVQDRVIRLEERLRLQEHASGLDAKQLVALRFASDGEAPALAQRAREEQLTPRQIKEAVREWRADWMRV